MNTTDSYDFIQMVRISSPEDKDLGEREIATNKFSARMFSKARANTKRSTCYICDKQCTSFCNSHSIPEFTLRHIAEKGKVIATLQKEIPMLGKDTGLNKAGTFQLICRDCDSKVFREYETPDAYTQPPTDRMLAQIALKDYLRMISRRTVENELYRLLGQRFPHNDSITDEKQFIGGHDLCDFQRGYNYAEKSLSKNDGNRYYLCFHAILDYVVPYAAQSSIILISDFEDNVINNVYDFSQQYHQESIHISVFPLEKQTIVLLFLEQGKNRYRKFCKQLRKLPLEDQLAAINYIIFAYTENVFLSATVAEEIQKNDSFMDVCRITADFKTTFLGGDPLKTAVKSFSLSNRNTIPNLLSKKYAIR